MIFIFFINVELRKHKGHVPISPLAIKWIAFWIERSQFLLNIKMQAYSMRRLRVFITNFIAIETNIQLWLRFWLTVLARGSLPVAGGSAGSKSFWWLERVHYGVRLNIVWKDLYYAGKSFKKNLKGNSTKDFYWNFWENWQIWKQHGILD